jgi:hypothetical protein
MQNERFLLRRRHSPVLNASYGDIRQFDAAAFAAIPSLQDRVGAAPSRLNERRNLPGDFQIVCCNIERVLKHGVAHWPRIGHLN